MFYILLQIVFKFVYRFWWGRVFFLCLVPNVTRVYRFWWGPCLSFCVFCPMLPVSIVFGGIRVYLSVPCAQYYPYLSFLVGSVSIFLCLVPNITRVYRFWWDPCLSFCVLFPMLPVSIVFGGIRVYLSVPCAQYYPCLSFLVGSVSIFLCLVPNVTRVYRFWCCPCLLSVSCAQCYPCLCFWWGPCVLSVSCAQCYPYLSFLVGSVSSFCVLCPMLPVPIVFGGVLFRSSILLTVSLPDIYNFDKFQHLHDICFITYWSGILIDFTDNKFC
jgi:hypothetical protein